MRNRELVLRKLQQLEGQISNLELMVSRNETDNSKDFINKVIKEKLEDIKEFIIREEES